MGEARNTGKISAEWVATQELLQLRYVLLISKIDERAPFGEQDLFKHFN